MTLIVLAAMGVGLGLVLLYTQLRPAPTDLKAGAERMYAPAQAPEHAAPESGRDYNIAIGRLVQRTPSLVSQIAVPTSELRLLQKPTSWFLGQKVLGALLGALLPSVLVWMLSMFGIGPLPLWIVVVFSPALAVGGFFYPNYQIKQEAKDARKTFTRSMAAYIELVALQRRLGASPPQALQNAAAGSTNPAFQRIHEELSEAEWAHVPAWDALEQLSEDINVPVLADIADIMRMSGESGTGSYTSLRARSESLRSQVLSDELSKANEDSEQMVLPGILFLVGFLGLLLAPMIMRMP